MVWTDSMINDYSRWLHAKPASIYDPKTGWTSMSTPFLGLYPCQGTGPDIQQQTPRRRLVLLWGVCY